ncbi:MAG: trigger factor [Planctomycetes bacterium]|nr:trigger factor [Planctomycetota bacterium]
MPSTLNDLGPCEKEIAVSVPADDIAGALEKQYGELRKQIVIPGFRAGKVPRAVLEKRYGEQVRHEVYHDLVRDAVSDALREHELEPVSEPHIEGGDDHDHHELPSEGELAFTFKVEVKPEFELPKYRGVQVERKREPVTPEQVKEVIDRIAESHAEWLPVEDGGYEEGDLVQATATIAVGDHVLADEKGVVFLPEQNQLEGLEFPDAHKVAAESEIDGEIEVQLKVPEDHPEEALRGEETTGKLVIEGYKRRTPPAVDDAFASTVGKDDLEAFKADVTKELEEEHDRLSDRQVVRDILDKLLGQSDIPIAAGPTERMVQRQMGQRTMHFQMEEGLPAEEAKAKAEEEKAAITESVERDTRAWLLVEAIAKKEKIFCLEEAVDAALAELAARHGAKPSAVREYYEQQGLIAEVRSEVVERKVCEFLRDQARIAEDEPGDGAAEEAGTEDA